MSAVAIQSEYPEYLKEILCSRPIPFELAIGVTGHRDLQDPSAVSALVRETLEGIRRRFRSGRITPMKVVVYSALAEGADRIVVREALRVFPRDGIEIRAVLPLPPDEYERDFKDASSRAEFQELLPKDPTIIPAVAERDEAYERAGQEIVDQSDLLIAIWDGRASDRRGGTAKTLEYARSKRQVSVVIVPAGRLSVPGGPAVRASRVRKAARSGSARSALEALEAANQLNELDLNEAAVKRSMDAVRRYEGALVDPVTQSIYAAAAAWSLPLYARADVTAIRYRRQHVHRSTSLFVLAALAVTAVAAQLETGASSLFALVEVGFMLSALAVYAAAVKFDAHERWLGYRSLAEEFRAGLFLVMTGFEGREVPLAADSKWYQRVFTAAWQQRPSIDVDERAAPGLQAFLLEAWVVDQIKYHKGTKKKLHHDRGWLRLVVLLLFALTVVAGLIHAFEPFDGAGWRKAAIFMAIAFPGWGAALTGIRDQRQHRRHENRSERTVTRLERLRNQVRTPATLASAQDLAGKARQVIAEDSAEWSGVEEFQDLELPT